MRQILTGTLAFSAMAESAVNGVKGWSRTKCASLQDAVAIFYHDLRHGDVWEWSGRAEDPRIVQDRHAFVEDYIFVGSSEQSEAVLGHLQRGSIVVPQAN